MARHRYKSYKRRNTRGGSMRGRKKGINMRWALLCIIAILAGLFIIKMTRNETEKQTDTIGEIFDIDPVEILKEDDTGDDSGDGNKDSVNKKEVIEPVNQVPVKNNLNTVKMSDTQAKMLVDQLIKDIDNGKIIDARNKLNKILLDLPLSKPEQEKVKILLARLSDEWLFDKKHLEGDTLTEYYMVKRGDSFSSIGSRWKVPSGILMKINGIKDEKRLPANKNIKVVKGPFHAVVNLSEFKLDLFLQDQYVKSYGIGTGKPGHETPAGKWRVQKGDKLVRPNWYDKETNKTYVADHPDYPLGERWIGIECLEGEAVGNDSYALHGTKEPDSIGKLSSRGCIRLNNEDIIELFGILTPVHSKVDINK